MIRRLLPSNLEFWLSGLNVPPKLIIIPAASSFGPSGNIVPEINTTKSAKRAIVRNTFARWDDIDRKAVCASSTKRDRTWTSSEFVQWINPSCSFVSRIIQTLRMSQSASQASSVQTLACKWLTGKNLVHSLIQLDSKVHGLKLAII